MINLIPIKEKKKMQLEFYCRSSVILLFLLSLVILLFGTTLIPSYLTSLAKKDFILQELEKKQTEVMPENKQEILNSIADLESKLILIESIQKEKSLVISSVLEKVLNKANSGVRILGISYQANLNGERTIALNGSANSREQLLAFRKLFEEDSFFKKVDLPISNFVKNNDIQFNLDLIF